MNLCRVFRVQPGVTEMTLAMLCLVMVVLALSVYVILDGHDIGVGLSLPFMATNREKHTAMQAVTFAWDGNESWLVLVGALLYGGFPLAYSTLLSALYLPVLLMLFAIILRGISLERQDETAAYDARWGWTFAAGSWIMALSQGLVFGNLLRGLALQDGQYVGGPLGFLNPVSLTCALLLVCGFGALGNAYLVTKVSGRLAVTSVQRGRAFLLALGAVALVLTWQLWARGLLTQHLNVPSGKSPYVFGGLATTVLAASATFVLMTARNSFWAWWATVVAALGALITGAVLIYPSIVPPSITVSQAASPASSLTFLLIGVAVVMPVILTYNIYAATFFRGKLGQRVPAATPSSTAAQGEQA